MEATAVTGKRNGKTTIYLKSLRFLCLLTFMTFQMNQGHSQTQNQSESDIKNYLVKGTVYNDQNLPLMGANVVLKGSSQGVITDYNGNFIFSKPLKSNDTLIFSYLGFKTQEYTIGENPSEVLDLTIKFENTDVILMGQVSFDGLYSSKSSIKEN